MSASDGVPPLTPAIVADDEALAVVIDDLMATPEMSDAVWEIAAYAMDLAQKLDPDDWQVVLASHEPECAFWRRVAAWAFAQGRRYPVTAADPGGAP